MVMVRTSIPRDVLSGVSGIGVARNDMKAGRLDVAVVCTAAAAAIVLVTQFAVALR